MVDCAWTRGCRVALLAALLVGCAAVDHALQAREVAGRPLDLRSAQGAARLRVEAQFDRSVAQFLEREAQPDFLFVESRARLYLFYVERDRVVMFERDLRQSEVTDLGRIPGSLLGKLPERPRQQILARRQAAARRAKLDQARHARAQPAPARAAPASAGTYFGAFDVEEVADRMRDQPTAADPGVRSWRRSKLADGRRRLSTTQGSMRFEVRPDAVSVASPASARTRSISARLRLAIARLNRAVFPNKAEAVSRAVLPLAKRVLADASGRTRVARRVQGRTVRIERRPAEQLVIYSIHP